jgi:hypothetical protein
MKLGYPVWKEGYLLTYRIYPSKLGINILMGILIDSSFCLVDRLGRTHLKIE